MAVTGSTFDVRRIANAYGGDSDARLQRRHGRSSWWPARTYGMMGNRGRMDEMSHMDSRMDDQDDLDDPMLGKRNAPRMHQGQGMMHPPHVSTEFGGQPGFRQQNRPPQMQRPPQKGYINPAEQRLSGQPGQFSQGGQMGMPQKMVKREFNNPPGPHSGVQGNQFGKPAYQFGGNAGVSSFDMSQMGDLDQGAGLRMGGGQPPQQSYGGPSRSMQQGGYQGGYGGNQGNPSGMQQQRQGGNMGGYGHNQQSNQGHPGGGSRGGMQHGRGGQQGGQRSRGGHPGSGGMGMMGHHQGSNQGGNRFGGGGMGFNQQGGQRGGFGQDQGGFHGGQSQGKYQGGNFNQGNRMGPSQHRGGMGGGNFGQQGGRGPGGDYME
jgi:hypothetical protein